MRRAALCERPGLQTALRQLALPLDLRLHVLPIEVDAWMPMPAMCLPAVQSCGVLRHVPATVAAF
jgi:hypothetical protein